MTPKYGLVLSLLATIIAAGAAFGAFWVSAATGTEFCGLVQEGPPDCFGEADLEVVLRVGVATGLLVVAAGLVWWVVRSRRRGHA